MTKPIKMDDHEDAEGHIDFNAYRKAQVANGERCQTCGSYVAILDPSGSPTECASCKDFHGIEEVDHSSCLRCPQCGGAWDPYDAENYEVLSEEEHEVSCPTCDYEFTVSTLVSYTFTSPPRLSEEAQEAWQVELDRREAAWKERCAQRSKEPVDLEG